MKTSTVALCPPAAPVLTRTRLADYVALARPRIALMVLFTVAVGVLFAAGRAADPVVIFHAVLGTALVASGASALNQLLERHTDARMQRTAARPLPSGRLQPAEALVFGLVLAVVGTTYLAVTLGQLVTPLVAVFTFASYVGVYTPLKSRTTLNTLIGAVPGALPPVIGWSAARGTLGPEAWALFGILFFWQLPHFFAIAWIYREDYGRAGLRMLPVGDVEGRATSRQMIGFTLALIVASFAPALLQVAGPLYLLGALALGLAFLARVADFARSASQEDARRVLRASLLYLPALFALLLLDTLSHTY